MKTIKISIFLALILFNPDIESIAQGFWTQKADFGGDARYFGSGMAIGNKGYIGLGSTSSNPSNNDFWQYNPATNTWGQVSNFTNDRIYAACFSIGNTGYVCSGSYWDGSSGTQPFIFYQDMWAYDPATNSWTQKAGFPGPGRNGAIGFEIFGKGYVGMGAFKENTGALTYYNDLYEYDPDSNQWTQKASLPGSTRGYCINFSIGKYLYVGLGVSNVTQYILDIWQYDTQTDTWTQKNNFPGPARKYASSFVIGSKGYIFGGMDASQYFKDLWEYDPTSDTWTQKEDLPSNSRYSAVGFSINNKGYIGTGSTPNAGVYSEELWEYTPSCDFINTNVVLSGPTIYALASGASYQWINCDIGFAAIDNETSQSFTPPVNGNYAVIVSQNGCSDTSDCIAIYTGINEVDNSGIIFYPNPSQAEIILDLKNNQLKSDIELIDMNGKIIKTFPASSLATQKLFVGEIPNGHYFLMFNIDSKKIYKEILITK